MPPAFDSVPTKTPAPVDLVPTIPNMHPDLVPTMTPAPVDLVPTKTSSIFFTKLLQGN